MSVLRRGEQVAQKSDRLLEIEDDVQRELTQSNGHSSTPYSPTTPTIPVRATRGLPSPHSGVMVGVGQVRRSPREQLRSLRSWDNQARIQKYCCTGTSCHADEHSSPLARRFTNLSRVPRLQKGFSPLACLRRRRLRLTSLVLATIALVAATPVAAQASVKDPTASVVISTTRATIANESGVHVLFISKGSSSSIKVVADIGATSGVETITEGSDRATIKVTPTYAYLSGNAAGLISLMGLSAKEQKKVGSDVIAMKAGTTPYKNLKSSLTIPMLANMLPTAKGTTYTTKNIDATSYYQLSWTTEATSSTSTSTSVLTLSEGTAVLPIREVSSSSSGTGTTIYSRWGEHVSASVPSTSRLISYSKVIS